MAAFRAAISDHANRSFSDEELMALAGPAEEGILQQLFPDNWEDCFEKYLEGYARRLVPGKILFPGVYEGLIGLAERGCRMSVVSGKTKPAVDESCKQARITDLFDHIIGGSADGDRKAEGITTVLESWSADPSQVVYIGDTSGDIRAAKAARTIPVGATWAVSADRNKLAHEGPEHIFETVGSFYSWATRAAQG